MSGRRSRGRRSRLGNRGKSQYGQSRYVCKRKPSPTHLILGCSSTWIWHGTAVADGAIARFCLSVGRREMVTRVNEYSSFGHQVQKDTRVFCVAGCLFPSGFCLSLYLSRTLTLYLWLFLLLFLCRTLSLSRFISLVCRGLFRFFVPPFSLASPGRTMQDICTIPSRCTKDNSDHQSREEKKKKRTTTAPPQDRDSHLSIPFCFCTTGRRRVLENGRVPLL
jgi:hypothetical protein